MLSKIFAKLLLQLNFKNNCGIVKTDLKVKILKERNQGCLAFGSCLIENVKNIESPNWLKDKLISARFFR